MSEDHRAVVLDRGNTSHLDRGLDGGCEQEAAEGAAVREQLDIGFSLILMFERDLVANLVELGLDLGVLLVTVRVELGQSAKALISFAMVDEPPDASVSDEASMVSYSPLPWRLGEEHDQQSEDTGRYNLDAKTDTPLPAAVVWKVPITAVCGPGSNECQDTKHSIDRY